MNLSWAAERDLRSVAGHRLSPVAAQTSPRDPRSYPLYRISFSLFLFLHLVTRTVSLRQGTPPEDRERVIRQHLVRFLLFVVPPFRPCLVYDTPSEQLQVTACPYTVLPSRQTPISTEASSNLSTLSLRPRDAASTNPCSASPLCRVHRSPKQLTFTG